MSDEIKNQPEVTFTPEQQEVLNREIARAKREAEAKGEAKAESIRVEGAARIAELQGRTDAQKFLIIDRTQTEAVALERDSLNKYFGPGSSGIEAQKLMSQNPVLYRQLRTRAGELGLCMKEVPPEKSHYKFSRNM